MINTLKQVFRWRSTKWWQSTQATGMKSDPYNHTRRKRKCGWHNRGCVWDKLATQWAGKADRTCKRVVCYAPEDKKNSSPLRSDCVNGSTVHDKNREKRNKLTTKHSESWGPRIKPFTFVKRSRQCSYLEAARWQESGSMGQRYRGRTQVVAPDWILSVRFKVVGLEPIFGRIGGGRRRSVLDILEGQWEGLRASRLSS